MIPKVLVVEDDRPLNRLIQKGFNVVNMETVPAYTLNSAVETLDAQHDDIQVIVLDLGLPDGNGWDVIERVNSQYDEQDAPRIIIITGYDPAEIGNIGNYYILQKPINVTELIRLAIQLRYKRKA